MKLTARIARTLTGDRRPARPLTAEDICAERAAMYGPCGRLDCPTCTRPAPLPFDPAAATTVARDRETRRAEVASCEDFGVDPRYI